MDAATLADWLAARMASDVGRADLAILIRAGFEQVLAIPLADGLPSAAFERALDQALAEPTLVATAKGAGPLFFAPLADGLRDAETPAGRWLSPGAREELMALASRPGLVEDDWIDVMFSQAATEQVLADTLLRALEDFSEAVPKVVQDMTPAALGKLASKLGGATGGMRDRVRDEVKKRLEPEIRRFVERATRKLLDGTAAFLKGNLDNEAAVEARRNLLSHALDRPFGAYVKQADPEARARLASVSVAVAEQPEARAALRALLLGIHRRWLAEAGGQPLGEVLASHGVQPHLDAEAVADAVWPAAVRVLEHPEVGAMLNRWAEAILDATGARS